MKVPEKLPTRKKPRKTQFLHVSTVKRPQSTICKYSKVTKIRWTSSISVVACINLQTILKIRQKSRNVVKNRWSSSTSVVTYIIYLKTNLSAFTSFVHLPANHRRNVLRNRTKVIKKYEVFADQQRVPNRQKSYQKSSQMMHAFSFIPP